MLIGIGLLAWRRRPYELSVLLFGTLLTYAGVHITKDAVDRPRPAGSLVETLGSSFPSGHAAYSTIYVALGVIAARVLPGFVSQAALVVVTVVVAAAIGATRVYLGAHYYSDVVAGWALGAFVVRCLRHRRAGRLLRSPEWRRAGAAPVLAARRRPWLT